LTLLNLSYHQKRLLRLATWRRLKAVIKRFWVASIGKLLGDFISRTWRVG
jgi:hypothetical protein